MEEKYSVGTMLKFVMIVLIIGILFYLITIFVTNKKSDATKKEVEDAIIQYEEIIIGNMFDQKEKEYYVLLKEKNDTYLNYYETYAINYQNQDDALKIYSIDLSSAFNKKYIGENNNIKKEKFEINQTTFIKIKNGDIVESYQGNEKITNKLKSMTE